MFKDVAVRRAGAWLLAGLLYVVWPMDIVPDFAVIIGWVDDFLIAALTIYMAYQVYQKRVRPGSRENPPEPDDNDPYLVLGVSRGACADEIKAAYRRRMAEYHPDKVAHLGAELKALAEKKAKAIHSAYESLR